MNRISPADQAIARLNQSSSQLNDSEMAFAVEHLIAEGRTRKMSVSKLPQKVVKDIIDLALAEANDADMPGVVNPADVELASEMFEAAPRIRGSHAGCTHDTGKVARAKCRRERARNA